MEIYAGASAPPARWFTRPFQNAACSHRFRFPQTAGRRKLNTSQS